MAKHEPDCKCGLCTATKDDKISPVDLRNMIKLLFVYDTIMPLEGFQEARSTHPNLMKWWHHYEPPFDELKLIEEDIKLDKRL